MKHKTSLDKALQIIDTVAGSGSIGVRPLSQKTGYPPSTIHRILAVLSNNRFVTKDPATKEYRLSVKFLELASQVKGGWNVIGIAQPIMRELMEASGETVNLVVFEDLRAVYIEQVANTGSLLRMFTQVGAVVDLYCSGVGKAYLASLEEPQVLDYLRRVDRTKHTAHTLVDEQALLQELKTIRRRGYAVDNQEQEEGVRCVAAAILQDGLAKWGMSISGPSSRLTSAKTAELGRQVKARAAQISDRLRGA